MKKAALIGLFAAGAMAMSGGAAAKPGENKGGPKDRPDRNEKADVDIDVAIVLGDRERQIVRDYYGSDCPPGLAKKNNGCLPPGIAKKRYEIGRRIPDGWDYLPDELVVRLPRLGDGYGYRMVDGDLVVVALASLIVMDAIGLY